MSNWNSKIIYLPICAICNERVDEMLIERLFDMENAKRTVKCHGQEEIEDIAVMDINNGIRSFSKIAFKTKKRR
jgi:hypothetical protein